MGYLKLESLLVKITIVSVLYWDRVSLCGFLWSGTQYVAHADTEHREIYLSFLELKAQTTILKFYTLFSNPHI